MTKILLANYELYDKLLAHKNGLKHYAFSVFLFDKEKRCLLQKRSKNKYHSGGLWSNTCCSHFANKEELENRFETARKRLLNEIGLNFDNKLYEICTFEYNSVVGRDLVENEIDYVFIGFMNEDDYSFLLNPNEVEEIKFVDFSFLKKDVNLHSSKYTTWIRLILNKENILSEINKFIENL